MLVTRCHHMVQFSLAHEPQGTLYGSREALKLLHVHTTRSCSFLAMQMGARDRVTETLRAVFSRHGAVAATSAAIGLATDEVLPARQLYLMAMKHIRHIELLASDARQMLQAQYL